MGGKGKDSGDVGQWQKIKKEKDSVYIAVLTAVVPTDLIFVAGLTALVPEDKKHPSDV